MFYLRSIRAEKLSWIMIGILDIISEGASQAFVPSAILGLDVPLTEK